MLKLFKIILIILVISSNLSAQSIVVNKKDAKVWGTSQIIKGKLNNFYSEAGILHLNEIQINFNVLAADSTFSIPISIGEGESKIIIEAGGIYSDTLKLELAYKLLPDIYAYAQVNLYSVTLQAETIDNPKLEPLGYFWKADGNNPAPVAIENFSDSIAFVNFNSTLPKGEYYFDVFVTTSTEDTVKARTFVTLKHNEVKPFNIKTDYAEWIDSAIIYEITPYIYVNGGKFHHITAKIPDIVRLGVNTIWIQPIYATHFRGQGYDIIDYFSVRNDLGTEQDLRTLIETAKANGLRVMFDFVPNHSSIHHPYAKNSLLYGTNSHYWDYYQRETDNAPYSQHYTLYQGFINYFWNDLPNLNYNNPEVQKWITEAAKFWIKKFDIDGYRFDAVWGVTARNPQFTKDLRLAVKRIKPEIIMLAEDKASQPQVFDERFDVGFDWTPEESWVSHWSWQTSYNPNANPTIFNYSNQNQRSSLLRNAITNNGNGYAPNAKILRFTDNNDHFYFITHHGADRTRMVSALLFTLNGIPLLYNGQEIGKTGHPYSTNSIFLAGYPNDYYDPNNLFPFYQYLIKIRKNYPALNSTNYQEISVSPSTYVFGFRRWIGEQNLFTIINMAANSANVTINIPVNMLNLDTATTYYLTDLLSGEVISGKLNELAQFSTSMNQFSAKIYSLADTIVIVGLHDEIAGDILPDDFELEQNYPNPFNPLTTISYSIPFEGKVELKVYDLLGKEISTLVSENKLPGRHTVEFNGSSYASGVYFYRMLFDGQSSIKKMLMIK